MPSIGIQLYTVREEMARDAAGTLRRLAEIGFRGVEFAHAYGGLEPDAVAGLLEEVGLEALGIYTKVGQVIDPGSDAHRYAAALDVPYMTIGLTTMVTPEKWPQAIETVREAAAVCSKRRIRCLYHNHWQEFARIGDRYALDILAGETDPALVGMEIDTAWVKKAGVEPIDYIRKFAGRLPMIHAKDIREDGEVTELGTGVLDFPALVAAAAESGVEWLLYEQDRTEIGEMKSAEASYRNLERVCAG